MLEHVYNIIIDHDVRAPEHGREVVDGLNDTYKIIISIIMITVKLPGAGAYDSHMEMYTSTVNTDISLAKKFQKHISEPTREHDLLDHGKDRKHSSKCKWTECEYYSQY